MGQSVGFVGVVCAVYLLGGFIIGGLALALQTAVSQLANKMWLKALPLTVALILWLAMICYRFVGVGGPLGATISGLYAAFGGWVYPHDLLAFSMGTIPILAGLVIGLVVNRRNA